MIKRGKGIWQIQTLFDCGFCQAVIPISACVFIVISICYLNLGDEMANIQLSMVIYK